MEKPIELTREEFDKLTREEKIAYMRRISQEKQAYTEWEWAQQGLTPEMHFEQNREMYERMARKMQSSVGPDPDVVPPTEE